MTSALGDADAIVAVASCATAVGAGAAPTDEKNGNASGTKTDAPIAAIHTPRRARRHAPKMLSTLAAASPKSAAQSAA
jgi:hypothetical protein